MSQNESVVQSTEQLPADGEILVSAIEQARAHLARMENLREYADRKWPPRSNDCAMLWRELLDQSGAKGTQTGAPIIRKGDLASPIGIKLDGRFWKRFVSWFDRYIAPDLKHIAQQSGIPALRSVRQRNVKGGNPVRSEALIFLIFDFDHSHVASSESPEVNSIDKPEETGTTSGNDRHSPCDIPYAERLLSCARLFGAWVTHALRLFAPFSTGNLSSREIDMAIKRRWRYGVSMVLLASFLLELCRYLPVDGRGMFIAFSIVCLTSGIFEMDRANHGQARNANLRKVQ